MHGCTMSVFQSAWLGGKRFCCNPRVRQVWDFFRSAKAECVRFRHHMYTTHPRTPSTFFLFPNVRNLVQARFFYFQEWCRSIQIVLLSHFYHNTVIPMPEQQQPFLRCAVPPRFGAPEGCSIFCFCAKPSGLE